MRVRKMAMNGWLMKSLLSKNYEHTVKEINSSVRVLAFYEILSQWPNYFCGCFFSIFNNFVSCVHPSELLSISRVSIAVNFLKVYLAPTSVHITWLTCVSWTELSCSKWSWEFANIIQVINTFGQLRVGMKLRIKEPENEIKKNKTIQKFYFFQIYNYELGHISKHTWNS